MSGAAKLRELIPDHEGSAVAVAISCDRLHAFCVPLKYLDYYRDVVYFHLVGGVRKRNETWPETALREVTEEIATTVTLVSSSITDLVTTEGSRTRLTLSDNIRPFCVYRSTVDSEAGFYHPNLRWVVGYLSEPLASPIRPTGELAIILLLTPKMMKRSLTGELTYSQIKESCDGSALIIQPGTQFDTGLRARPAGLALEYVRVYCGSPPF